MKKLFLFFLFLISFVYAFSHRVNDFEFFPFKYFNFQKEGNSIVLVKEPSSYFYKTHPNIKEAGFLIYYSCKWKEPIAVEYPLYGKLVIKHLPRDLYFKPDYELPRTCRSYPNEYDHSGYDRGHHASNASFDFDRKIQKETFLMSNISPQAKWLNRKYWAKIEKLSRYLAVKYKKVYVMTGNCGSKGELKGGVNIPKYWFKIIYIPKLDKTIAFLAPNVNEGMKYAKIKKYLSSVEEIKKVCGF